MKTPSTIRCMLLATMLSGGSLSGSTNLLPGLTYYEGPEQLKGRLVFLYITDAERQAPWRPRPVRKTSSEPVAAVYEFDLSKNWLRKVTDCPKGIPALSDQGDTFCIVCPHGDSFHNQPTNATAFVYSELTGRKRTITLDSAPKATVAANGHVFFQLEKWDHVEDSAATEILAYDVATDQRRTIELPDASRWQSQHYDRIHAPQGQTNELHFYYHRSGKRLGEGKDYQTGMYSLEIRTGEIRWFGGLIEDADDPIIHLKAFDGLYVYFAGPQAPVSGFKLVSSPLNVVEAKVRDPEGKQAKVLHAFSERSASKGGDYGLNGLSPCGRYVLVRFMELRQAEAGWLNIYYLVDVLTGKTRVLLRDEVERKTKGSMWPVRWVK